GLTPTAERMLLAAHWDGNVRELKNAIERACMLAEGSVISERELSGALAADPHPPLGRLRAADGVGPRGAESPAALDAAERGHIVEVLRQVNGNRMAAAKLLGIS